MAALVWDSWEVYKRTRQEKRRQNAHSWRDSHLRPAEHAFHFWDGDSRYSRRAHLIRERTPAQGRNYDDTYTYCGLVAGCISNHYDYQEHHWGMGDPVVPMPDVLCRRCRAAVKASKSHPFRRRLQKEVL